MSVSASSGIRKSRSARRQSTGSMPPRGWSPAPPLSLEARPELFNGLRLSPRTVDEMCDRLDVLKGGDFRLALLMLAGGLVLMTTAGPCSLER